MARDLASVTQGKELRTIFTVRNNQWRDGFNADNYFQMNNIFLTSERDMLSWYHVWIEFQRGCLASSVSPFEHVQSRVQGVRVQIPVADKLDDGFHPS